jgi:uncharacterized protein YbjT (DUF2867 family)
MILVVGATGLLGSEICRRLTAGGKPTRALVRSTSDQAKVDKLKRCGAEIVQGDLRDGASLNAAWQGVTAVISTVSAMPRSYQPGENDIQTVDLDGVMNLIDAAKTAGVEHFVYTSLSGQIDLDFPLRNAKRTVEQRLKDSGLSYTILRPSFFMELWLGPARFNVADAKAQIYGRGDNPISWISLQDVAQFAVASLDNPAARNTTLELGGPQALGPLQAVQIFEEVCGRAFELQHVPGEALEEQEKAATDPMRRSFAGLVHCYAQGDPIDMRETLEVFPVRLTSVRDYAQSVFGTS